MFVFIPSPSSFNRKLLVPVRPSQAETIKYLINKNYSILILKTLKVLNILLHIIQSTQHKMSIIALVSIKHKQNKIPYQWYMLQPPNVLQLGIIHVTAL
jgi:regulatory protein YycH of two-component signal transduction system YycFG